MTTAFNGKQAVRLCENNEGGQHFLTSVVDKIRRVNEMIGDRNIDLEVDGRHPEVQSINDFELYGVISHFLLEVSRDIKIGIQNDDVLIKSLISHIKNMHNWSSFEFELDNDTEAASLFEDVRKSAEDKYYILENFLNYQMNSICAVIRLQVILCLTSILFYHVCMMCML